MKADQGKIRMDLIPPEMLMAIGTVITYGANKYAERDWEDGMEWNRFYAAALRHMNAWQSGEEIDPESGYPHMWHATTSLIYILTYQLRGIGTDNRPKINGQRISGDSFGPASLPKE